MEAGESMLAWTGPGIHLSARNGPRRLDAAAAGRHWNRTGRRLMRRQAGRVSGRMHSGGPVHKDILTNSTIFPQIVCFRTGLRPPRRAARLTSGNPTSKSVARLKEFFNLYQPTAESSDN